MKTLYLGAMKSSGSAERRDGGAYKALAALRKISGSYVILFFPTDVCFSHFSAIVNERRVEIYLIRQHRPACDQKLKKKKKKSQKSNWPVDLQTA